MDRAQVVNTFWNSFGWNAYERTAVPDDAPKKYITYEYAEGYIGDVIPISVSLWTRSTSWAEIEQKALQIGNEIGLGGKVLSYDGGKLWILRGSTFAQRLSEPEDNMIRRIIISINMEFISD